MDALKRIIGVVLIIVAAIVAIHTVIEPLYHTSTEDSPSSAAWDWINWISVISIILGLIFGYIRMSHAGADSSVQEFLAANTQFYGFMFVAIIFLWNWFGISNVGSDFTAVGSDPRTLVWIIFDAILPLLNGALGVHLLRSNSSE